MDANDYPSESPKNPVPSLNNALNSLRWRFFKSRQSNLLAKSFACRTLSDNPHFIEISEAEYRRLEMEQAR